MSRARHLLLVVLASLVSACAATEAGSSLSAPEDVARAWLGCQDPGDQIGATHGEIIPEMWTARSADEAMEEARAHWGRSAELRALADLEYDTILDEDETRSVRGAMSGEQPFAVVSLREIEGHWGITSHTRCFRDQEN